MIVEFVSVLVLHCSRCNAPWLDTEYEEPGHWKNREHIDEAFKDGTCAEWRKIGDRYLCDECWWHGAEGAPVEAGWMKAIDEAVVARERAGYADASAPPVSVAPGEPPATP